MFQELLGVLASTVFSISSTTHPDDMIVMKVFSDTSVSVLDHAEEYVLLNITHILCSCIASMTLLG